MVNSPPAVVGAVKGQGEKSGSSLGKLRTGPGLTCTEEEFITCYGVLAYDAEQCQLSCFLVSAPQSSPAL